MIESIINNLSKHFHMEQELIDNETGWYLLSICTLKGRVIYKHKLDLSPLYKSMKSRLDEEQ